VLLLGGGSLFGSAQPSATTTASTTGGSLFGSGGSTGFSFGAKTTAAATPSLFSNPAATTAGKDLMTFNSSDNSKC